MHLTPGCITPSGRAYSLFKPVRTPRPSLTRCLRSTRLCCSSSRSSSSSWAPPRRCRPAARSAAQPALRTAAAMADIKTGIFAKNVQKRLNRAQEKVSRGWRAAGQVARGGAGADGGAGFWQAVRCRAAGPGAASCGAREGVDGGVPCLCSQWLQPGMIHSGSVGTARRRVRQGPADSRSPGYGAHQTTGAHLGWPRS